MEKLFYILKVFPDHNGKLIEIQLEGVYTEEMADDIINKKSICSDINAMCDEYIKREVKISRDEDSCPENLYTYLELKTLKEY